jgi:hypothetical protein
MIEIRQAGFSDCLDFAGDRGPMRRFAMQMRQGSDEAFVLEAGGEPLALAFLFPEADGGKQFCLGLKPLARVHMRELCRAAQLILGRMAEDGPVRAYVRPGNRSGERMARIVGFSPDPDHPYRWIMRASQ